MKKNPDVYLPLFVNYIDPIAVYVVADKLIALERTGEVCLNNSRLAYYFLGLLSKNKQTSEVMPETLLQHFNQYFNLKFSKSPCICGIFDLESNINRCLAMTMAIKQVNNNCVIQLNDFALLENTGYDVYVNDLNLEVQLSAKEAFILFSNICFESASSGMIRYQHYENEPFDKELIKLYIDKQYKKEPFFGEGFFEKGSIEDEMIKFSRKKYNKQRKSVSFNNKMELFCLDYLEYLLNQLSLNAIDPELILRLNGSNVLACLTRFSQEAKSFIREIIAEYNRNFDFLSTSKKICYLILFTNAVNSPHKPNVPHVYTKNQQQLYIESKRNAKKILKELAQKFPLKETGELFGLDDVFMKYLGVDYF